MTRSRLGCSVEDAAKLLALSPTTIRRRLADPEDPLSVAPGRPICVSNDSLHAERRRLAERLGMYLEPPTTCSHPELDKLELENERLRRLVQTLRLAQSELLRNIGDFADPKLPNE
jgi:hypothetical protein